MEHQMKATKGTMKDTDQIILKFYLIEKLIPEYTSINLFQVIEMIKQYLYYEKLKTGATKTFLQWVSK